LKPARPQDIPTIYCEAQAAGRAIALFRLPHLKRVQYITGPVSRRFGHKPAFAFVPFHTGSKPYYILDHEVEAESQVLSPLSDKKQKSTSQKQYKGVVKKIIAAIAQKKFEKVVAARLLAMDKPGAFDPLVFFKKLCAEYPSAFVSLTHIPGAGLWIGASPEVLVAETAAALTVYSLAGTKSIYDTGKWNDKELREQSIVTNFIRKKLSKIAGNNLLLEKGPVTHSTGKLKHLLTVFTAGNHGTDRWKEVVKALHPTPAVAGLPQKKSVQFIQENEHFDRSFYAGYLGPIDHNGDTNLYVNLRCVQVADKQLLFYAGCGITIDSDPGREWAESERKIDVLKSLI
jgi:isochorismate synthase